MAGRSSEGVGRLVFFFFFFAEEDISDVNNLRARGLKQTIRGRKTDIYEKSILRRNAKFGGNIINST